VAEPRATTRSLADRTATGDGDALHAIGRQSLYNDPNLAESLPDPVIARHLALDKVHDLGAKEGRPDAAVRPERRRSRGSDGGLTRHGCTLC
jgi:hypothetical protein